MQMEFQQSEGIAVRRRWILVLVDSADGVTGKTGQTGTVKISKNGAVPVSSTNSIVEIDSSNMPGQYYIELTAAELSDLGAISIYYKASGTLAFHDRGFVTYDNPYQSQGGFSGPPVGSSGKGGITKTQATALLADFRKIIKEEIALQEKEEDIEDSGDSEKLNAILAAVTAPEPEEDELEPFDYSPILEAIALIPGPNDYSKDLGTIGKQLGDMGQIVTSIDFPTFAKAVSEFQSKMQIATKDINGSLSTVKEVSDGFKRLEEMMTKFGETFDTQTDMDKRFAKINGEMKDKAMDDIKKQMTDLSKLIVNAKYDIMQELNKPPAK